MSLTEVVIVRAMTGRDMDKPGALIGYDEIGRQVPALGIVTLARERMRATHRPSHVRERAMTASSR